MKRVVSIFLATLYMVAFFSGCGDAADKVSKKVVIATTFAAFDWTREITKGSDEVIVRYLCDSSVDMHSYSPSAADLIAYKGADLVIAIGGESEEWLEDAGIEDGKLLYLSNVVETKEEEVKPGMEAEEEEGEEPELDEHIWLSIRNACQCVNSISNSISSLDQANESLYRTNAEHYITQLEALDKAYMDAVERSENRVLVFGDRFPFRYLADDYGLDYYAAFVGCSAESEASFETVVFLANKLDELGLKRICTIGNNELAASIVNQTKDKDTKLTVFDAIQSVTSSQGETTSYMSIMEKNLESLKDALGEVAE